MTTERLTDAKLRSYRHTGQRQDVKDEGYTGKGTLYLRIGASKGKAWSFVYRHDGTYRRMTLGEYPVMGLKDAHKAAMEAALLIDQGQDPSEQAKAQRAAERQAATVAVLAEQFIELYSKAKKRSWAEDQRILWRDVLPVLGTRKAKDITRRDVAKLLDGIAARGAPIAANRTLAVVRKMFAWAVSRGEIEANPAQGVTAPAREQSRDRVLVDAEITALWRDLEAARMDPVTRQALRFMLTTGQRLGEVCAMTWEQIDGDVWTIPGAIAKNGNAHRVPLSGLALAILDQMPRGGRVVFPSRRGDRAMSPTALSHALRNNLELLGLADVHPHDLRRTAASHMTMLGHNRLVVSKVLNHVEGGVTAVYDRHTYDAEKRAALNGWAAKLEALIA